MTEPDFAALRAACVGQLTDAGCIDSAPWAREAVLRVERERFVPPDIWKWVPGDGYRVLSRTSEPLAWAEAVYDPDKAVVTQINDGQDRPASTTGSVRGAATSSVSALDIVSLKLGFLDLQPGHRVLDIGTGSGFNAALLEERAGPETVTTIELDEDLAAQAARNLRDAGYTARAVRGDGEHGVPHGAPYDRLICTASVHRIPPSWLTQVRPGGIILTPYGTHFSSSGLLKLTVGENGTAEGRLVHTASYMWLRSHREPGGRPPRTGEERLSASPAAPDKILDGDWHAEFAIGHLVPGLTQRRPTSESGGRRVLLWDGGDSFASVFCDGWDEDDSVLQQGPRSLWDEVLAARAWWEQHGRPEIPRYGLTITADGGHHVWLDTPENALPRGETCTAG